MTSDSITAIISIVALVISVGVTLFVVIKLKRENDHPPEDDKSWVYVDEED